MTPIRATDRAGKHLHSGKLYLGLLSVECRSFVFNFELNGKDGKHEL